MLASETEQTLEWTYRHRRCTVHTIRDLLALLIFYVLIGGSLKDFVTVVVFFVAYAWLIVPALAPLFLLMVIIEIVLRVLDKKPKRKLSINRQMITLTDTDVFRKKVRQMEISGAAVCGIHLSFSARLFTFDRFRTPSAYHVEIARYGETFLFPCVDEKEQKQIVEQIQQRMDAGGKIS